MISTNGAAIRLSYLQSHVSRQQQVGASRRPVGSRGDQPVGDCARQHDVWLRIRQHGFFAGEVRGLEQDLARFGGPKSRSTFAGPAWIIM